MSRHRPRFLLWAASGYRATCGCHYWQPVRFDRPLPSCRPLLSGRAA